MHVEKRKITFGFQAFIVWTKCIDFPTVMLGKGEKQHVSFGIHSSLPTSLFWSVLASDQRGPWRTSMLWAAWGLGDADALGKDTSEEFLPFSCFILHAGSWFAPPCLLRLGRRSGLCREERSGVGTSRAQFIHPLFNTCFPGSSRPGSACLSSLHQLTRRCPYRRQPQILSVTSASLGPEHSNKCLDIYSSAQMLSAERALCVAGLGKAASSPHALFCRWTTLLTCQTARYSALLSLPGASSATMLIFILPAAFYLRLVEKEHLRSPQKIGVRELAAIAKGRTGGCVLSPGHKYSDFWLATSASCS